MEQDKYVDTAVRAVTNKRPVPEIDFTLHTMEDGTQVSTLERVCKGMYSISALVPHRMGVRANYPTRRQIKLTRLSNRRASARLPPAD